MVDLFFQDQMDSPKDADQSGGWVVVKEVLEIGRCSCFELECLSWTLMAWWVWEWYLGLFGEVG